MLFPERNTTVTPVLTLAHFCATLKRMMHINEINVCEKKLVDC